MSASDSRNDVVLPARAFADTAEHRIVPSDSAPRWAKLLLLPAVVAVVLSMDQGSKLLAQSELAEQRVAQAYGAEPGAEPRRTWVATRTVDVVPGAFSLRYVENPAAAFSLTSSLPEWIRKPFLVSVSLLAMLLIVSWYWRTHEPDWLILSAFSLILGGALGNLVDRMAYGYVIDFIDWHLSFINRAWPHWPTFNIADSAICVGAAGVIYRTFRPYTAPADDGRPARPWSAEGLADGRGASDGSTTDG
jgi:signal peptidase II